MIGPTLALLGGEGLEDYVTLAKRQPTARVRREGFSYIEAGICVGLRERSKLVEVPDTSYIPPSYLFTSEF